MRKKVILIVDDEWVNRELYKEFLVNYGYEVVMAVDGVEGLEMALTIVPDLIVLDFLLPKLNGCEIYKKLRENPSTKDIPVLVVSAYHDKGFIYKACPGIGKEDVYRKPINHRVVKERIDTIINSKIELTDGRKY